MCSRMGWPGVLGGLIQIGWRSQNGPALLGSLAAGSPASDFRTSASPESNPAPPRDSNRTFYVIMAGTKVTMDL